MQTALQDRPPNPIVTGLSFNDLRRLVDAIAFASTRHSQQRRKDVDASPYINHPLALLDLLVSTGGIIDADVLIAAVLHDTIEDTETSHAELAARFGCPVADLVMEVTDDKSLEKQERKRLQIVHVATASHGAKLIKLADKTCNLRDLHACPPADWPQERLRAYFDWASAVIDGARGTSAALEHAFDQAFALRP